MAKNIKREIIEWAALLLIGVSLYFTNYHTEVIGILQRIILTTGIVQPTENKDIILADYNLLLEDLEGNAQTLSDWKDKPIFLNFWATWCPPCKEEMPSLDNMQANLSLNNLKVFPINIGKEKLNKVEEFFVKLNLKNLEPFFDPEVTLAKTFSLRGVPTSIFINKQGEEFARVLGDIDFDDKIFLKWIEKYN